MRGSRPHLWSACPAALPHSCTQLRVGIAFHPDRPVSHIIPAALPSVDPPTLPPIQPVLFHPSIHPRFLRTAPDLAAPALPTLLRVQAERAEVERAAAAATSAPCAECVSKERELSRLRQAVLEVQSAHADSETKSREDLDALRMVEALVRSRFTRVWGVYRLSSARTRMRTCAHALTNTH